MQTTFLEITEIQTTDANILCDTFPGTYQLICFNMPTALCDCR